ncbi:phosphopantetheine-binding protein [Microbacterium sp. VKM Ac-2923]|uniref:phosphopantetheine-binding protein n=1 Tax=Microbacterium sp. VKM Ac-2923 TaxID=2929476 RepID=UPI001FB4573A|nr:phosphopantetheine-binding protein [Microbacterium sp. VKM Ac-2923]MCJ1708520.1 phosphopantetheine-binding protein [Microbacterium sp. VKM Ac-2923]
MTITAESVRADVAEVLLVPASEVDPTLDLRDQGMDSVRIMELVEKWRRTGASKIDYVALAEDQRLAHWIDVLTTGRS